MDHVEKLDARFNIHIGIGRPWQFNFKPAGAHYYRSCPLVGMVDTEVYFDSFMRDMEFV